MRDLLRLSQDGKSMRMFVAGGAEMVSLGGVSLDDPPAHNSRTRWRIPFMIVVIGIAVSASFITLGFTSEDHDQESEFLSKAAVYPTFFQDILDDYQVAALWAHQAARHGDLSRERFRDVYDHISVTGLQFQSIEYLPRVTHDRREAYEADSREYFAKSHPNQEYKGFTGLEYTPDGRHSVSRRSEQEFYYVQHFVEPFEGNERAIDYDAYSSSTRRSAIEQALTTGKAALSARFGHSKYQIVLIHPGLQSSNRTANIIDHSPPRCVSKIHFHFAEFLRTAAHVQTISQHLHLYVYDSTPGESDTTFLGAIAIDQCHEHGDKDYEEDNCNLPEIPKEQVKGRWLYEQDITIMSRQWTILVVQEENRLNNEHLYIFLGGLVIFIACACLALWVHTDSRKAAKINRLKRDAESQRARLMVSIANQAAEAERELNDYVAHEVRNPLSAAISAHSFVRTEFDAKKPFETEGSIESVRADVSIIGNSLHFINDLLRSMLDNSRASTNRLELQHQQTDILADVFKPIHSLLYLRDCKVEVLIECPKDLVITTDCLRLKQVVLNLSRNSSKFVQNGFIRLKAKVNKDTKKVQIFVEDSGPGVPSEKRERLFSKFQSSLDSLNQGTGIGLSLSKKLVDLMEMNLWLDESFHSGIEGSPGARFVIDTNTSPEEVRKEDAFTKASITASIKTATTVPLGSEHESEEQPQEKAPSLPKGLSVLFVDDDMILRKLFARTIQRVAPDWTIHEASNGETALTMVEEQTYELIFVDQYMASVEQQLLGTETARAMRSRGVKSVICGLSANDVRTGFEEAGANGFIFKPFPTESNALTRELLYLLDSTKDV